MPRRNAVADWLFLSFFLVVTALALLQIPRITIDGSTEAFIPADHQVSKLNKAIEDEFGSIDSILIGVRVNFGSVLEPDVLAAITDITRKLVGDPLVDSVTSIANVDYVTGTSDGMQVVPLSDAGDASSVETVRRRINDWPDAYLGTIVSKDYRLAGIVVQPIAGATDDQMAEIYSNARAITSAYASANISIAIAGTPVIHEEIARSVSRDVTYLVPIAALLIVGVLFLSFRRLEGVVFPIVGVAVALAWVVGVIGVLGITFTMATLLVPVLLLVVGSAYGIHVMQHFYEDLRQETGFVTPERVREIVGNGVGTIRVPVILAGVTTIGGFVSQLSSPLGPFRVFGVLSAVGVVASQITALVLIPVLIRLRYRRGIDAEKFHAGKNVEHRTKQGGVFRAIEHLVRRRVPLVVTVSVLLLCATLVMIPGIRVGTNVIDFFGPGSRVRQDTNVIHDHLGGTGVVSVLIRSPQAGDILDPEFLHRLDAFAGYVKSGNPHVTGVRSIVPSIKRINSILNYDTVPYGAPEPQAASFDFFGGSGGAGVFGTTDSSNGAAPGTTSAPAASSPDAAPAGTASPTTDELAGMVEQAVLSAGTNASAEDVARAFLAESNYHGAAFNEIPQDPAKYGLSSVSDLKDLLTQYMVLYSGNLSMFVNDALEPSDTLVTIQLDDESNATVAALRDDIDRYWSYYLTDGWSFSTGGPAMLGLILSDLVTRSQFYSLIGALVIVWVIVTIMFRSPTAGLFGIIPVLFALMGVFLSMSTFGFHLDIVTSLLAALAIGIGVDYGIHYMSAYRRAVLAGVENPLDHVYRTTGSAILFNAASVSIGMLALLFSRFIPMRQLGVLFTVSMAFAGLASLIVLPMALELTKPKFLRAVRSKRHSQEAP